MPFGIRRFLTQVQFLVVFRKCGIVRELQVLIGYGTRQYRAVDGAPIPLSGISPLPCLPFSYATSLQVVEACSHSFPTFPYAHAYPTAQPFVCFFQKVAHIGMPKVVYPPSDCMGQFLLALLVAPAVTARCQLFELRSQFGLGFRMNTQASLSLSHIERVAKELLSVDTADMGLLAVHF